MSYCNRGLGEFLVGTGDDWPKTFTYIERKPQAHVKGELNPWEKATKTRAWQVEQEAWKHLKQLKAAYIQKENRLKERISYYNGHVKEYERLTNQTPQGYPPSIKMGVQAVFPIFALANSQFLDSIIGGIYNVFGGSVQKKRRERRLKELLTNIDTSGREISKLQAELPEIIEKMNYWLNYAKSVEGLYTREMEAAKQAGVAKKVSERVQADQHWRLVQELRQKAGNVVSFANNAL